MRAVDYSNLGRYRLITFNHDGVATPVIALDDCGVGWQACPELELPGYDALDFDGGQPGDRHQGGRLCQRRCPAPLLSRPG